MRYVVRELTFPVTLAPSYFNLSVMSALEYPSSSPVMTNVVLESGPSADLSCFLLLLGLVFDFLAGGLFFDDYLAG